jgi:hypothetical protein
MNKSKTNPNNKPGTPFDNELNRAIASIKEAIKDYESRLAKLDHSDDADEAHKFYRAHLTEKIEIAQKNLYILTK